MDVREINMNEFSEYVYSAFIDDDEIVEFYDRAANVKTPQEAIDNVCDKIKTVYPSALIYGIEIHGNKEGYFVVKDNLLISFGMNIKHRNRETLSNFWDEIRGRIGNSFHAMLYSHNERAISFLRKGGMKILYDHITILSYN